jgi:hypothetical protein
MSRGPGDFDGAMPDYDYARGEAGDIGPVTNKANNSPFRIVQYSKCHTYSRTAGTTRASPGFYLCGRVAPYFPKVPDTLAGAVTSGWRPHFFYLYGQQ